MIEISTASAFQFFPRSVKGLLIPTTPLPPAASGRKA